MIQPDELKTTRPMHLHGGVVSTTTDVWSMLVAAHAGDIAGARDLAAKCPALLYCQYDYTTPMQLAVREGHLDLVRFLIEQRALDPDDRNHPFLEPLTTLAEDRGHVEILALLHASLADPALTEERGDTGKIERNGETMRRFEAMVDTKRYAEVEAMLKDHPELARDNDAFWGEGILAVPANGADRRMLELLINHGATVPDVSKWGARYYFKHIDVARFLLDKGMNPDHQNWREFTLLHDMAHTGDVEKATLLLERGASINAIDDEYRSTPIGYAAHFGKKDIVDLLLDRGADKRLAGADWATPRAWAARRGYTDIAARL